MDVKSFYLWAEALRGSILKPARIPDTISGNCHTKDCRPLHPKAFLCYASLQTHDLLLC